MKLEKKQIWYRVGVILVIVLAFGLLLGGVVWRAAVESEAYQKAQEQVLAETERMVGELYEDEENEVPTKDVTNTQIEVAAGHMVDLEAKRYQEARVEIERRLEVLREFVRLKGEINGYLADGVLKTEVEAEAIKTTAAGLNELPESYRKVLQGDFDKVQAQYQALVDVKTAVEGLFTDEKMTVIKPRLTRAEYKTVVEKVGKLSQKAVAKGYEETLARVDKVLVQREKEAAEARQRALEARRRAEELRRQQKQEEMAAWRVLNVPYHSQNLQQIYNGCEAASMLMALQYKGYLKGVDLHKYAEMMPKSDDYNTGFVGSIYDLQPKTYVHWIAPAPLAKFGRESSGNANVVDVSGASLADLDKEVVAGNPVIIYVTFLFNPLKEWLNGAPKNLHVVLLTGYNEKTGTHRLTDPWTQSDGGRTYDIPRAELEKIYNAVGKRAVVVR